MKTLIVAAIRCCLMFLLPTVAYAISAQWDLDPISGDWNTAANWTPMGVPNGPADIATFALSNTTGVSISTNTEVNGITFTSAATNPYTITASAGFTLTLSGIGITNNSGITQNFATALGGEIRFTNSATAGSSGITNNGGTVSGQAGGFTRFFDTSSAGSASITNKGTALSDSVSGITDFQDSSTAGSASITNESGAGAAALRYLSPEPTPAMQSSLAMARQSPA